MLPNEKILGEIVIQRIFDLGGTIDIKKAKELLPHYSETPVLSLRSVPEYLSFAHPLHLNLEQLGLDLNTERCAPIAAMARVNRRLPASTSAPAVEILKAPEARQVGLNASAGISPSVLSSAAATNPQKNGGTRRE